MKVQNSIGIVTQISDDKSINFILNNDALCSISDVVFVEVLDHYVLAKVTQIHFEYYVENISQYFISKATSNSIHKVPGNAPRYGRIVNAQIVGYYYFDGNAFRILTEKIGRYTPQAMQQVFLAPATSVYEVFGLSKAVASSTFVLGYQSYPIPSTNEPVNLHFNTNNFKKISSLNL